MNKSRLPSITTSKWHVIWQQHDFALLHRKYLKDYFIRQQMIPYPEKIPTLSCALGTFSVKQKILKIRRALVILT